MTICGSCLKLDRDKGYAWVILGLSFLSHIMHVGFNYAVIGVLTIAHQEHFNITRSQSSLISSVHIATFFLTAPVSSVLVKKIGCRWTTITGGILIIVSLNTSYLSTEPWHAVLLFGILCGAGISKTYIASTEVISQYFSKYKYFAFSTVVTGYYVGLIAWPIPSQKLIDVYGYSKAMSLLSIPQVFHLLSAAFFFDRANNSNDNVPISSNTEESNKLSNKIEDDSFELNTCKKVSLPQSHPPTSSLLKYGSDLETPEVFEETEKALSKSENKFVEKRNTKDDSLSDFDEGRLMQKALGSESRLSIKEAFVGLLKNPKVWALLLNAMFWAGNITSFYVLVSDFVIRRNNITEEEAATGVTITGTGNLIGCISVIPLGMTRVDRVFFHVLTVLIMTGSTISLAFCNGKIMFYLLAGVWGYGSGSCNGNLVSAVSTFCPQNNLVLLLSLHLFSESISALASPPLVVYISELKTDQMGMVTAGCFGLCSCLSLLPVIISNTRKKMRQSDIYKGFWSAMIHCKDDFHKSQ